MIRRLCLALLLLPLLCTASFAALLPAVGERVSGLLPLLDKPVPLPPGEWQVASTGFGQIGGESPGAYGVIGGVLLVRPGGVSGEFLLLHANALPVRAGWGQPAECATAPTLFQSVGEPRNLHNACSFVVALRRGQLLRSQLPALGSAGALDSVLPSWALLAGFRVSDRRDMLDIRYGVTPRQPDPASWFAGEPPRDRAHRVTIERLGEWAQLARQSAQAALRGPVEQAGGMPTLDLGLGDAEREAPKEQISALRLSLYKLATYRVPSSAFSLTVAYAFTGNLYAGAWLSFWQMLTHTGVYLGNELAWEMPSPTPVNPLRGTASTAPARDAQRDIPADDDPPVQVAANAAPLSGNALTLRRFVTVDGKQVPLPSGRWTVLGSSVEADVTGTVLGQVVDEKLRGLVVIHSNHAKTGSIVGPSAECGRRDVLFAVVRYDTPEDGFCAYGKQVMPMAPDERAMHENPLWARAAQQLADDGISVPVHLLMVGARARTQDHFLDARYYFAVPSASALSTAALQDWADLVQVPLEQGVRGRLGPEVAATPWPLERGAVRTATLAQAHEPLEDLAAAGAISPAVLQEQSAAADAALLDREQQRLSLWSRSFFKVATYRVASYVDSVAVTTLVTGSPAQGVALASVHAVAKPLLAYANEIYWAHSSLGKAPAALRSADFPDIGTDR